MTRDRMKKIKLTDEQADTVLSYADGAERVMRELGITRAMLEDSLLDFNIERCPTCRVYADAGELVSDDEIDGYCDNCRRYAPQEDEKGAP